ncbi:hypothetical protein SARC_01601 [Sphaeroforma arctica JP610]|uniref:SET domain-containing protein n=1 Tax=Sphaeroforma arctica JP610 TaxID=667725 RepID=A0A0L0GBJ2_9EUKA|nr:hypothetical protein SARC_01601 [Sphaeroforma arctica JP610]KNC86279.1 hypothetical protein SARC_01601 [Sphaeroforma arctica JP610]|eukprot:XP_014160181.1 hypothetical protein SARC_01601 [Sphaeroforma arctica JP610]
MSTATTLHTTGPPWRSHCNTESPSTEPQTEGVANGHSLPPTYSDAPQTWVDRTEDRAQESDTHAPDSGYYVIPNVLAHSSLWYVNELTGEVVHHPPPSHSQAQAVRSGVCWAVFISTQDIKAGDELFIDYQLAGPPYPEWARDWYS